MLSRKEEAKLISIQALYSELQKDINKLKIKLIVESLANFTFQPIIFVGMKGAQALDPELVQIIERIREGKDTSFTLRRMEFYT